MAISILGFSILYMGISFILTALYVRFRGSEPLAVHYRKHFLLFPSFPLIMLFRLGSFPFRLFVWHARDLFEFLSGKPTYHRRKIDYYGRRKKLRRRRLWLDSRSQTEEKAASNPSQRPSLVSDNDAMISTVPEVVSKY
ncbi:MAG: hypothetical protein AAF067_06480 [Pseudomonadota bacterium]